MALTPPPCLTQNCLQYAFKNGYCSEHQPQPFSTNFRKDRLPKNWVALRQQVLRRDNYVCYLCGEQFADGVDHILPNDDNSLDNLRAVHDKTAPFCHRKKTAQEAVQAKKNLQPTKIGSTILERLRKEKKYGEY